MQKPVATLPHNKSVVLIEIFTAWITGLYKTVWPQKRNAVTSWENTCGSYAANVTHYPPYNKQECVLCYCLVCTVVTSCVLLYCVCIIILDTLVAGLPARSPVIRKVLQPATSAQIYLVSLCLSISECWDGSQDSMLLLHASHAALPT